MKNALRVAVAALSLCVIVLVVKLILQDRSSDCNGFVLDTQRVKSIKARIVGIAELETISTDLFEVPDRYRDLLLAIIGRPIRYKPEVYSRDRVCELVISYEDGQEVVVAVVWQHETGPVVYSHDGCYYTRLGEYNPINPATEEFTDEAAALAGLLNVVAKKKDLKEAELYERHLRLSVGLSPLPQIGDNKK